MAPSLLTPNDVHDSAISALPASDRLLYPHNTHYRARFPSLTEFPDSPSVYSHAYPSPEADLHADTLSRTPNHSSIALDLDDETASTIRSLSTEGYQDDSDVDDFTDDASHRISLQGPKIRFHSRAPWETDDFMPHTEEPDTSPRSGTFGSKLKGTASRADSLIRTFTRGSSLVGRPSIDSTRSQGSSTSFEIPTSTYSSTRGALYDLARQSMSTTSLSSSTTSSTRNQRTPNYPKPSPYFPHTHGSSSRATVSLDVSPSLPLETVPTRSSSSDVPPNGRKRSMKPFPVRLSQERHSSHDDFIHPYANPDLVVPSYTPSSETIPSHHQIPEDMSGSDSNCTITDSISARSAAFSAFSPDTSTTSLTSREGNLRVNGKEISSPISVVRQHGGRFVGRNTRFLSLHPPPPGFDAPQRVNPTVTLLTLQEAQARERIRANIVNGSVTRTMSSFSDAENIPESTEDQNEDTDTIDPIARSRTQSISAGIHQTIIPLAPSQTRLSETEESSLTASAPGRALKHKKSGFMRLFGGRNSEGEREKGQSPPALPYGDRFAEPNLQPHGIAKPSRLTRPRVGKPASSPALRGSSASSPQLALSISGGDSPDGKGPSVRRRQAPSLSIVTRASDQSVASTSTGLGSPTGSKFTPSLPLSLTVPQSAPPGNAGFPGLQLRPVSGCFSAHFADIVTSAAEETQRDVHTPSSAASSTTALSPFTPVSTRRSDDASATAIDTIEEENLIIKELQDQLASAKKAWQQQVWELQGQIRDLTAEVEVLRAEDSVEHCEVCGRGEPPKRQTSPLDEQMKKISVVDRPRARTGGGTRFGNGN